MPILAAFAVPHPPLIIPNIGKGEEDKVSLTIDSYNQVAREVASLEPDTIIISSPHAPFFYDGFYLIDGDHAEGNFARFGAREVSFSEDVDSEFVEYLENLAMKEDFPAKRVGEEPLDHGVMVPLYFIRKYYKKGKIVVVGCSSMSNVEHYRLGRYIQKTVFDLNRKVVYIASGDLSHKLQTYGPYGYEADGPVYDQMIMDTLSHARFGELIHYDPDFLDRVAECGHPSFTMMAGALDGYDVIPRFYSHEDITGVGYGICSFYPNGFDQERHFLKDLETDPYVLLARNTITSYITTGNIPSMPTYVAPEMLSNQAGVFVSIHKNGALRGCIGTFLPTTNSICSEIMMNAVAASTRDPRFSPITEDELKDLDISVDVLSPPEDVSSLEELDPKRYGVIVRNGSRRGLLLPDLEGVDDIDTQLMIAKSKAGIAPEEEIQIQRFEVIRHH